MSYEKLTSEDLRQQFYKENNITDPIKQYICDYNYCDWLEAIVITYTNDLRRLKEKLENNDN